MRQFSCSVDANRLKFEAERDIFSRYLLYAMVCGVVDKWMDLFRSLPADVEGELDAMTWIHTGSSYRNLPEQPAAINLPSTLMCV